MCQENSNLPVLIARGLLSSRIISHITGVDLQKRLNSHQQLCAHVIFKSQIAASDANRCTEAKSRRASAEAGTRLKSDAKQGAKGRQNLPSSLTDRASMVWKKERWVGCTREREAAKDKKKPNHGQLLNHFFLKGQDFVGRTVDKWSVADALNSRIFSAAMTR